MTTNKVWIIEPRDPLIARDGKPFGMGASATTLPFPFPSTTTGGVRTRAGLTNGSFIDSVGDPNEKLIQEVKKIAVRGALLVDLNKQGEIENWFMPAPSDALLLEDTSDKSKAEVKRLVPLNIHNGATNLKQEPHENDELVPLGLVDFDPNKPFGDAPRFWRWDRFKKWLLEPEKLTVTIDVKELGHNGAVEDTRTHVAIDPNSWTSLEGQLFQTRGLEFTHSTGKGLNHAQRLGLAINVEDHQLARQIRSGLAPLGGERRIVAWRESKKQLPDECLGKIQEKVAIDKTCRVVLLTPACFMQGSRPTWLLTPQHNVTVTLQSIATGRAQVVSGWDFEIRKPKPTRRLAPAGSVYFLKLQGKETDIKTWVEKTWMQCVSDEDQDRCDGFGLAVVGVWDGILHEMKF
ncbi:MAG: type III-B CRISPR module-associated protein Cmr3 [bacterium]